MNTTANKITIFRIVLIPVFLVLAYTGLKYWALAVYIIACLSDVADGLGLVASRVAVCAGHQAHMVLRLLAEEYEP